MVSRAHFERVSGFVERAIADGASVLLGGEPNTELGGLYFGPTILTDVARQRDRQEEVFGPVLTVQTFGTEEQAIEMANDTRFGLAATLVTGDPHARNGSRPPSTLAPSGSTASSSVTWARRSAAPDSPASAAKADLVVRLLLRHQEHRVLAHGRRGMS